MPRTSALFGLLLPPVLNGGCTLPKPPPAAPPPSPIYYVAAFQAEERDEAGALPQQVDVLAPDANKLLARGKRVAFVPPDKCVTITTAPSGSGGSAQAYMACGVLISGIEKRMAKAGYEVISWQTLKPQGDVEGRIGVGASALSRARELHIDVMFEIDQLSVNERGAGQSHVTGLTFYEQRAPGDRRPFPMGGDTAGACKAMFDADAQTSARKLELSATFSTKAVDVGTGRAIWYYQKSLAEDLGGPKRQAREMFFRADGHYPKSAGPAPKPGYNGTQTAGGTLLWTGAGLGGIGLVLGAVGGAVKKPDDPSTSIRNEAETGEGLQTAGQYTFYGGIASAALGGLLVILGNKKAREESAPQVLPQAEYPPAAAVACRTPPVVPHFVQQPVAGTPVPPSDQASYTFSQTTAADSDARREREERLAGTVYDDFIVELGRLAARP